MKRSNAGRARYRVTVEISPESEADWNQWHEEHHLPDLLVLPGFLGATKWRDSSNAADGWPRYIIEYQLESAEALQAYTEGPDAVRLRADHEARFGKVTRASRQVLTVVRDWGAGG